MVYRVFNDIITFTCRPPKHVVQRTKLGTSTRYQRAERPSIICS